MFAASPIEYLINTPDEATKSDHKILHEPPATITSAGTAAATATTRKTVRTATTTANETAGAYLTKSSLSSADNSDHDNNNNSAVSIQLPAANESIGGTQLQMSMATYAPLHNKKSKSEINAAKSGNIQRTTDTRHQATEMRYETNELKSSSRDFNTSKTSTSLLDF